MDLGKGVDFSEHGCDYTPGGAPKTSPWDPEKLLGVPCTPTLLQESRDQAVGPSIPPTPQEQHRGADEPLLPEPPPCQVWQPLHPTWEDTAGLLLRDMDRAALGDLN